MISVDLGGRLPTLVNDRHFSLLICPEPSTADSKILHGRASTRPKDLSVLELGGLGQIQA